MKLKLLLVSLVLILSIPLVSCGSPTNYEFYDDYADSQMKPLNIQLNQAHDETSSEMDSIFREAYGTPSLLSQELSFDGETANFTVVFADDVSSAQINSIRSYSTNYLLNGELDELAPTTYDLWRMENTPKAVLLNLYVEDTLILQNYFDGQNELTYENTTYELTCRQCESDECESIMYELSSETNGEAECLKSLVRDAVIFQIYTEEQITPDTIEILQAKADSISSKFTRVVLEFYADGEPYYCVFLINGSWATGNWAN